VLVRAEQLEPATPPRPATSARAATWVRLAVPILILVLYGVYKLTTLERGPRAPDEAAEVGSLSGVRADVERVRLDAPTREVVARLEALKARGDWAGVLAAVNEAPPAVRVHPVVRAFEVIARVERGSRAAPLLRDLRELEQLFSAAPDQRPLLDYLRLMRGEILLSAANSPEALMRYNDQFRQILLNQEGLTPRGLAFRVALAEQYEAVAGREAEAAGRLMRDKVRLTTARSLHQQALRWVTAREGWLERQPVSSGRAAVVAERVALRIRELNEALHGVALPFGGKDSSTWTGEAGHPLHDHPGGTW
jgi:alkylhydroperoxidase family enzyme